MNTCIRIPQKIYFHTDPKDLKDGYAIRYAMLPDGMCSRNAA